MWFLIALAEDRIQRGIAAGEFSDLPGEGKPLDLEDDLLVPEERRVANRVLKNAGFAPLELGYRKEIADLERIVAESQDQENRRRAIAHLAALRLRLALRRNARRRSENRSAVLRESRQQTERLLV